MIGRKRRSIEQRNARRNARIARWNRPIEGRLGQVKAWANMLLSDHGLFRLVYLNAHRVGSGKLWRSAQPAPHQLRRFHRHGVRSVVCLRGQREYGSWPLERQVCAELGLDFREIRIRSREAPDKTDILELKHIFEAIEYPALIHCKSGADRAGLAAALFLIFHEKVPAAQALRQLSWRYGHVRSAKTGILYRFIRAYTEYSRTHAIAFEDWVRDVYDPAELNAANRARTLSDVVVDLVLRRE